MSTGQGSMISSNNMAHLHFTTGKIFTVHFLETQTISQSYAQKQHNLREVMFITSECNNRKDMERTETMKTCFFLRKQTPDGSEKGRAR